MTDNALTELDEKIIALIEQNGRRSNREIAKLLDISERQAGLRLTQLIESGAVSVITVVDAFAAGFNIILAIGVQVADRPAADVAEELARLPNVVAVALMAGQYDIEVMLMVEHHAALTTLVKHQLTAIPGIRALHPSLFLDVVKYETGSGPINALHTQLAIPENTQTDDIDRAIIARLWDNAWETNDNIAASLGLSESTVRTRVNQLRSQNLIHITAMRNVAIGADTVFAIIGIDLSGGDQQSVLDALCGSRQLHFVASVLGRYDIIAQVLVRNTAELTDFLDTLARLPGIRTVNCAQALKIVKYDYRWRIVGPR